MDTNSVSNHFSGGVFGDKFVQFKQSKVGKVIFSGFGIFILLGGLVAGTILVKNQQFFNKKAYISQVGTNDLCNFVSVIVTEPSSCPRLNSKTGQNVVSKYEASYSIKNISGTKHTVAITKSTYFCEAQMSTDCNLSPVSYVDYIDLNPGETKNITMQRTSDRVVACGSYKTLLAIDSIDGNTKCRGRYNGLAGVAASSMCQTNISCSGAPISVYCDNITAYSTSWKYLTDSALSELKPGQKIYFCATGVNGGGAKPSSAKFTINGAEYLTTTVKPGTNDLCYLYTIPTETKFFEVTAMLQYNGIWY